jgi:hypothetical protein
MARVDLSWDVLFELCHDDVGHVPVDRPVQPLGSSWHGGGGDDSILVCEHGAVPADNCDIVGAKAGVEEPGNGDLLPNDRLQAGLVICGSVLLSE